MKLVGTNEKTITHAWTPRRSIASCTDTSSQLFK